MDQFWRNFRKLWGQSLPFATCTAFAVFGLLLLVRRVTDGH